MNSNKKHKRAEKEPNEERQILQETEKRTREKTAKRKNALAAKEKCNPCSPCGDSVKKGDCRQKQKTSYR